MATFYRIIDGLLEPARLVHSPNQDARPDENEINLLVIHNISLPPGQFGGPYIEQLFTNGLNPADHPYFKDIYQLRVSAHLLLRRNGDVIQYVPFKRRAWHAGQSCFRGRARCNDFSIGIELEGCDETPYSAEQYQQLVVVTQALMQTYPQLSVDRICGHEHVAPGRKTDPGPYFDWRRYFLALNQC